jgi:hypothetical protein
MSDIVKTAFGVLGCAVAGAILFAVLLGNPFRSNTFLAGDWKGVLYYAAQQIETPIAKYYHNYTYYPRAHEYDVIDTELGASVQDVSDLSSQDVSNISSKAKYSTGWR